MGQALRAPEHKLAWAPQAGPQEALIHCPVFEVCYGGARGGGKTDGSLGDWIFHQERYGKHARGLFIRRTLRDLEDVIERAKELYQPLGAKWQEQKAQFRFANGALLRFRYLERDADAQHYQGHAYTRVYIEELTQFPSQKPIDLLRGCCRSAHGVPCGFRATCNPGGPGHTWVKARYIDNGPYKIVRESFDNPFTGQTIESERVFIPAKLSDNPILLESDPGYVARLHQVGSEALVQAWLLGLWDIVEGAFFDNFRTAKHVVEPFAVPATWLKFRAFDWGYASPFSVGWYAVVGDDYAARNSAGEPLILPRGCLVKYREWYGMRRKPNGEIDPDVGLRLEAEPVAAGVLEREAGEVVAYGVADPSIFLEAGGPSIGERMIRAGCQWRRGDNRRVPQKGAIGGWDQMRSRLTGDAEGRPMLVFFSTCKDSLRTIPSLPHDPDKPEDLDTEAEDHAADETRYACMSRPWNPVASSTSKEDYDPYEEPEEESNWKTQ